MRLVILADGTWNKLDSQDRWTNVAKLNELVVNDSARGQIAFYDPGVGTHWYDRVRGGALGVGLSQNIKDCYRFLVKHWQSTADEIFLFGFSRGAYTVRSLGGLINFVGLVRNESDEKEQTRLIDVGYDLYRDAKKIHPRNNEDRRNYDGKREEDYIAFRREEVPADRQKVPIKFIGVWDTVGALGIPLNLVNQFNPFAPTFHDTSLCANVEHARHAVAIDEKRKAFEPTLWQPDPRVLQVYFVGVHSDVGGGYGGPKEDTRLSTITLDWMIQQAREHGLLVNENGLPKLDGNEYSGLQHESWTAAWKLTRRFDRPIEPETSFHESVWQRLNDTSKSFRPHPYEPPSVSKPWERFKWLLKGKE